MAFEADVLRIDNVERAQIPEGIEPAESRGERGRIRKSVAGLIGR
jgi:hypothetical protein